MTTLARPLALVPVRAPARLTAIPLASPLVTGAFALYAGLGAYLTFGLHAYYGDAYSRVANAFYVLFSRDPHLAAIGFVWMPLPSVVEMLLLPLKGIFPALADQGFAGVLMSAAFMALAVGQVHGLLRDVGLRRSLRFALVAAFALHPMILYFGANGASEAPTIFFTVLAARYLARHAVAPSPRSLVIVGLALAGAYLTRYEAAAAALGVAGFLGLLALVREVGPVRSRLQHAAADAAVALTPFALVFVGWAVASWLLVGSPFTQLGGTAGDGARAAVTYVRSDEMQHWAALGANEVGLSLGPSLELAGLRLVVLSLAAPIGLLWAGVVAGFRRDLRALAILAVLGPMLAFMVAAYSIHLINPWLRYFILVIPLGVLLVGTVLASLQGSPDAAVPRGQASSARPRRVARAAMGALAALAALGLAFGSMPVAAAGMLDRTIAWEESLDITPLLGAGAAAPDRLGSQLKTFATELAAARYVDGMPLPRGSVLVDVTIGFPIVLQSADPNRYVITPDRDFLRDLADPASFGIRYLLVPDAGPTTGVDAIARTYPHIATNDRFATAVATFPSVGVSPAWTLYHVVGTEP